jgi:hypothetical protein
MLAIDQVECAMHGRYEVSLEQALLQVDDQRPSARHGSKQSVDPCGEIGVTDAVKAVQEYFLDKEGDALGDRVDLVLTDPSIGAEAVPVRFFRGGDAFRSMEVFSMSAGMTRSLLWFRINERLIHQYFVKVNILLIQY